MTAEDNRDAMPQDVGSLTKEPVDATPVPAAAVDEAPVPGPADAAPEVNPYAPPTDAAAPPYPAAPGPYEAGRPGPYPPYGAQGGYGGYGPWGLAPYPPPPSGYNGFAIAALVTALTCVLWPLAIAFAITGLVQVRKRNQRGTGLAVSGLLISSLGLLLTIGLVVGATLDGATGGSLAGGGVRSAADLAIGDCFDKVPGGQVKRVSCATAHDGEAVGHTLFTGQAYPDAAERKRQVGEVCGRMAQNYAMDNWAVPDGVVVHYFYPEPDSWADGDRDATCFLTDPDKQQTGSLRRDASDSTSAQLAYLKAMDAIDEAAGERPSGSATDDPAGYRSWSADLAKVLSAQTTALDAGSWDPDVRTALNAQLAELRQRIPALQQAARSITMDDLASAIALADQHRGYDQQKAVRRLLQLSTDESWLDQPAQGGGSPPSDGAQSV
ncbi:DUF4190 domain-containing protein [Kitasatospora kifunensis]|uniref:DUF4190 domain-containing protein n=1 Tax=Kitasatospora kifunensis TaxID=58351 RepID=A0A7W7VVC9_KITKI|nr:DUF4190 domain-containing protein [Kitasatospora kifunensis]MBB4923758.1 hypothetical protein [Kitasatospora kifunensis]